MDIGDISQKRLSINAFPQLTGFSKIIKKSSIVVLAASSNGEKLFSLPVENINQGPVSIENKYLIIRDREIRLVHGQEIKIIQETGSGDLFFF